MEALKGNDCEVIGTFLPESNEPSLGRGWRGGIPPIVACDPDWVEVGIWVVWEYIEVESLEGNTE